MIYGTFLTVTKEKLLGIAVTAVAAAICAVIDSLLGKEDRC